MLIIGIAGGSGSGKTTVVSKLISLLRKEDFVVIPQDSYYKDSSHLTAEEKLKHNFEHAGSIDFDLQIGQLSALKEGKSVEQPV